MQYDYAILVATNDDLLKSIGRIHTLKDFDDAYKPDIFSSASFSQDEQKGIILTSAGICVGIGLTDLIVQIVRRSAKKKKKQINYDDIAVVPIAEDEDAQIIPLPSEPEEEAEADVVQEIEE